MAVIAYQPHDELRIWEPLTGFALPDLPAADGAYQLAWSPDGAFLAVAVDAGVQFYDTAQWQVVRTLPYTKAISALAWSPDGRTLAAGRDENLESGAIDLWDVGSAKQTQIIPWRDMPDILAWSPDSRFLAVPDSWHEAVQIWDVAQRRSILTLHHSALVDDVDWAPDGQRLAVVTDDKIWIWAPATGALLKTIPYAHNATAGRWSPDGAYFAVAGLLAEVTVYRMK